MHDATSLPTTAVVTGIDDRDILKQALDAVKTFEPPTEEQAATVLKKTAEGRFERIKMSNLFDGAAMHPEWLG